MVMSKASGRTPRASPLTGRSRDTPTPSLCTPCHLERAGHFYAGEHKEMLSGFTGWVHLGGDHLSPPFLSILFPELFSFSFQIQLINHY